MLQKTDAVLLPGTAARTHRLDWINPCGGGIDARCTPLSMCGPTR